MSLSQSVVVFGRKNKMKQQQPFPQPTPLQEQKLKGKFVLQQPLASTLSQLSSS